MSEDFSVSVCIGADYDRQQIPCWGDCRNKLVWPIPAETGLAAIQKLLEDEVQEIIRSLDSRESSPFLAGLATRLCRGPEQHRSCCSSDRPRQVGQVSVAAETCGQAEDASKLCGDGLHTPTLRKIFPLWTFLRRTIYVTASPLQTGAARFRSAKSMMEITPCWSEMQRVDTSVKQLAQAKRDEWSPTLLEHFGQRGRAFWQDSISSDALSVSDSVAINSLGDEISAGELGTEKYTRMCRESLAARDGPTDCELGTERNRLLCRESLVRELGPDGREWEFDRKCREHLAGLRRKGGEE